MTQDIPLIAVRGLRVGFHAAGGTVAAVDDVDFSVRAGETLAIVGESGSGKSVMSLSLLRLVPSAITTGEILFRGDDLLTKPAHAMRDIRGGRIGMIFQEPNTSLNPVQTIGDQIVEAIQLHEAVGKAAARARAVEVLELTGIPSPRARMKSYPHELSGGMRQRAMIAMALACRPELLIADEPTTALDVTVQAQILDLMRELKANSGAAIILITHDLGVVAEMADRVAVMYAGRIVEIAPVTDLFDGPEHPYTIGLLSSMPSIDGDSETLTPIEGSMPDPLALPAGCRFQPRCPFAIKRCAMEAPPLETVRPGHLSACWRAPLLETLTRGGQQ
ncbi:oligopeptide/dipeptide ABC transporter ATP-binding protein [Aminobacter lissarensis]|uniref:Oligopeptide/dipeptide ABC transporter ATP-binding protein n=1 Tax=Aminobacter carboxidus TaxID=376165 RepID=A0A8E1WDX7_9HYPH|nr:ABC transporter ATP-binding protein [Aminobacter lissarensis]MBB6466488.1 oligopeptide/dipeptide ABC transporter ATP-binding protein [Aminobacter lissarensis]